MIDCKWHLSVLDSYFVATLLWNNIDNGLLQVIGFNFANSSKSKNTSFIIILIINDSDGDNDGDGDKVI